MGSRPPSRPVIPCYTTSGTIPTTLQSHPICPGRMVCLARASNFTGDDGIRGIAAYVRDNMTTRHRANSGRHAAHYETASISRRKHLPYHEHGTNTLLLTGRSLPLQWSGVHWFRLEHLSATLQTLKYFVALRAGLFRDLNTSLREHYVGHFGVPMSRR